MATHRRGCSFGRVGFSEDGSLGQVHGVHRGAEDSPRSLQQEQLDNVSTYEVQVVLDLMKAWWSEWSKHIVMARTKYGMAMIRDTGMHG